MNTKNLHFLADFKKFKKWHALWLSLIKWSFSLVQAAFITKIDPADTIRRKAHWERIGNEPLVRQNGWNRYVTHTKPKEAIWGSAIQERTSLNLTTAKNKKQRSQLLDNASHLYLTNEYPMTFPRIIFFLPKCNFSSNGFGYFIVRSQMQYILHQNSCGRGPIGEISHSIGTISGRRRALLRLLSTKTTVAENNFARRWIVGAIHVELYFLFVQHGSNRYG